MTDTTTIAAGAMPEAEAITAWNRRAIDPAQFRSDRDG